MANENVHNCGCHGREEIELTEGVRPMAVLVDEDGCDCECNEVELYTAKEPDVLLFDEYCEEYVDDIVAAKEAAVAAKEAVETNSATIIAKENIILDDMQTVKRELREGVDVIRKDLADDTEAIKNDVNNAKALIRFDITQAEEKIKDKIRDAVSTLSTLVSNGTVTIKSDIAAKYSALVLAIGAVRDNVKATITAAEQTISDKINAGTAAIRGDIADLRFPEFEELTDQEIYAMFNDETNQQN